MAEFDGFAEDYDRILEATISASGEGPRYFADYKARYLADRIGIGATGKILDFGCGIGNVAAALARRLPAATIHGYDPSPRSVERINPELKAHGRFSADLETLDGDYDVVLMAGVLHHVAPGERAEAITTAVARLAPGGQLAVFEHNPINPLTRRAVDTCPLDRKAVLLRESETAALISVELILRHRAYIVFFPHVLRSVRALEDWLGWCPLGAQYVVVGQKEA